MPIQSALVIVGFTLVLLGGVYLIHRVERWRKAASRPEPADQTDWRAKYEDEHRKRLETVAIITDIQKERDQYKKFWWDCALEHSAAQHFMAAEYSRVVKICKRNNVNLREKPEMSELPLAYEAKHGEEKRVAETERIESSRTPEHAAIEAGGIAEGSADA